MAENFYGYTEVDPNTRITVTSSRVTWASLQRNEDAYVYKDMTAGYFAGDFTHLFAIRLTGGANNGFVGCWALTNLVDDLVGIDSANGDYLAIYIKIGSSTSRTIAIQECDGGSITSGTAYGIEFNTTYYLKVVRDESVGTYGTIYLYIYSDSARTTLLATQSVTLNTSKKDFRYVYACVSYNASSSEAQSAYTENMTLYNAPPGYMTYPSDAQTRVTSLTHRYDRGTYTLELGFGEVIADFGIPTWLSKARTAVPTGEEEYTVLPGAKEAIEKALEETTWGKDIEEKKLAYEAKKKAAQAKTDLEQEIAKFKRMIPAPTPTPPVSRQVVTDPALRRYLPKAPTPEVEPWWQKYVGSTERIGE